MTKEDILKIIPHGEECLLIQRAIILSPEKAHAAFDCSGDEPFFSGHYPGKKVLPGHIIVEAMGQAGALLAPDPDSGRKRTAHLVTIERMRFKKKMIPPFSSTIEVLAGDERMQLRWLHCRLRTEDGLIAAEGTLVIHYE